MLGSGDPGGIFFFLSVVFMVWAVFMISVGWLAIGEDPVVRYIWSRWEGRYSVQISPFFLCMRGLLNRMRVVVVHPLVID